MLEFDGVAINYGPVSAVRGVSLTVARGEIVALLGPNGAGKTSLLSAAMGLRPLAAGSIRFKGEDLRKLDTENRVRRGLTLTPEGRKVFSNLTVLENLELGAATRRKGPAMQADIEMCFDLFPILAERRDQNGGSLSGGEQQMLAIARALMSRPALLMLDEPSLGLAPRIVGQIFRLIRSLRDRDLTILLVEQNAHEVLRFADRAYVLSTGELRYAGPAARLQDKGALMQAYIGELVA
ncbi:ABC transporter ATP-binding protein [Zavarzinia compransoris]|uniref:ABC transporter ATP-binding protein n=1 Tax=Zavarzinia compransoris TaxID=1264899 RepID=A0A317DSI4_9PROT|nr:ABC transporter ATP-binding protein [Zavarzinia compransoris]PWR17621.1 ABC transporter ATP-binding protein [Zavarzinia compransoris]TDP44117.1 branched-chain amino acid transport system ATP-binding protein [Zavarzinia compransoris]